MTIVLKNDKVAMFDVDDTLIKWSTVLKEGNLDITDSPFFFYPHNRHIDELIKLKTTGWTIVVHSAGGYEWATKVINALEIESYVDLVMTKCTRLYDDLPAKQWLPKRIYNKDYE